MLDTSKIELLRRLISEWQDDDKDVLNKGREYRHQFIAKQS